MRAARFRQFGGPEVSSVDTVPTPQPGADEVRLKIAAVGLNRADCAQYRGKLPSLSSCPPLLAAKELASSRPSDQTLMRAGWGNG